MTKIETLIIKGVALLLWACCSYYLWAITLALQDYSDFYGLFIVSFFTMAMPFAALYLLPESIKGGALLKFYIYMFHTTITIILTVGTIENIWSAMFESKRILAGNLT